MSGKTMACVAVATFTTFCSSVWAAKIEIPAPAGGYPVVAEVGALPPIQRAKPGDALKVPMYKLADAGAFDPAGQVVMQTATTERGYEAIYVGVPSGDPAKGAKFAVYSIPARKVVTLAEDVNALIQGAAGPQSSQRSICPSFISAGAQGAILVYFATANSPEPDGFPGGHIVEFNVREKTFRDVGVVAAGYSVRFLLPLDATSALAVVGKSLPQNETKLYKVNLATGKADDMNVADIAGMWPAGSDAYLISGNKTPLRTWQPGGRPQARSVGADPALKEKPAIPPVWIEKSGFGVYPGLPTIVRLYQGATFRMAPAPEIIVDALLNAPANCIAWINNTHWTGKDYPNSPMNKGVIYCARSLAQQGAVELTVAAFSEEKARDYGPILDSAGAPMTVARAMVIDRRNDFYVAGIMGGALQLAVVEDVFQDECLAMDDERAQKACAGALAAAVKARAWSFTAEADHLDRPYDAIGVASDGTIYAGTMPHHPTRGTMVFRYDPKQDKLYNLGDIDVMSKQKSALDVPGMMHDAPVCLGDYMFFTGQDPFYGSASRFPELPKGARYPGSHLLAYHLKTGAIVDFGIPAPGKSAFWNIADPQRNLVYTRMEYHNGPIFCLNVATGQITETGLTMPGWNGVCGPDGKLYFTRSKAKGQPFDLVAWDPATKQETPIASNVGEWRWIKGQDGKTEAYANVGLDIWKLDLATRQPRKIGPMPEGKLGGDYAFRNGVVYEVACQSDAGVRVAHLYTMTVADGKVKHHGIVVDQKGRIGGEINAIDVGPDGTVYMAGQFWPKPGDHYLPRLEPPQRDLADDCFMVVKGVTP
jgi:hypothetical protein